MIKKSTTIFLSIPKEVYYNSDADVIETSMTSQNSDITFRFIKTQEQDTPNCKYYVIATLEGASAAKFNNYFEKQTLPNWLRKVLILELYGTKSISGSPTLITIKKTDKDLIFNNTNLDKLIQVMYENNGDCILYLNLYPTHKIDTFQFIDHLEDLGIPYQEAYSSFEFYFADRNKHNIF